MDILQVEDLGKGLQRVAARKFGEVEGIVETVFIPAIRYLDTKESAAWVWGVYFLPQAEDLFGGLSLEQAEVVLTGLMSLVKLDHHAERLLTFIAASHPVAVWAFLEGRILRKSDGADGYEAFPYQLMTLKTPLADDAALAAQTVLGWYQAGDPLFRFNGGRLLSAVFPALAEPFALALMTLVEEGPDDTIKFVLDVLENYQGDARIHEIAKAIVDRLPDGDRRFGQVEVVLESTGVVGGAFGFADAFRRKRAEMTGWLEDSRPAVRAFAERYIRHLDTRIASEHRTAEQREELRRRDYDGSDDDDGAEPPGLAAADSEGSA